MRPFGNLGILVFLLASALILRLAAPSPGSLTGDHAFLMVWSRYVAEATHVGLSPEILRAVASGNEQTLTRLLVRDPGSLIYATLWGLFENPEKITRLLDVVILATWFRLVGYSIEHAELLMILVQLGTIVVTYFVALRTWDNNEQIALLSAALMAFLPWPVQTSRWVSWHVFGQLTFALVVLLGMVAATRIGRSDGIYWFTGVGVAWGLSLYSNSLIPLLAPLVLLPAFMMQEHASLSTTERVRAYLAFIASGLVSFLPALVFLTARWSLFIERNVSFYARDYYGAGSLLDKMAWMVAGEADAVSVFVLVLAMGGTIISLYPFHGHGGKLIPVFWLGIYAVFSAVFGTQWIHSRTVLNAVPPLVILASATAWWVSGAVRKLVEGRYQLQKAGVRAFVAWGLPVIGFISFTCQDTVDYLVAPDVRGPLWFAASYLSELAAPGTPILTDVPQAVQLHAPRLDTWHVISAESLASWAVDRDGAGYLSWRYPSLESSPQEVVIVLANDPRRDQEIIEIIKRTFNVQVSSTPQVSFGTASSAREVRVYVASPSLRAGSR